MLHEVNHIRDAGNNTETTALIQEVKALNFTSTTRKAIASDNNLKTMLVSH